MIQYDLYDGVPPHIKDCETSENAAILAIPKVQTQQNLVLNFFRKVKEHGATTDEICAALELPVQTICPRKRELEIKGLIVYANKQRKTRAGRKAKVYCCPEYASDCDQ